jgi:hypothetical protein
MRNKLTLITTLVLLGGLVIVLSWTNAFAQGPVNTHPKAALYVDNQWHVIPPATTLWYIFDLNNERLPVEIILYDGHAKRLLFNIYTPDQIGTASIGDPIGRGSAPRDSSDLVWRGTFFGGGTFFIEVGNPTETAQPFLLRVSGAGVILRPQPSAPTPLPTRLGPSPTLDVLQVLLFPAIATLRAPLTPFPTATPSVTLTPTVTPTPHSIIVVIVPATATPLPTPVVTPSPTPVPVVNDWWTSAIYVVNNRTYTIPGNSERWFAFDYAGDRSKIEIRIPEGNAIKLQFRLYTFDQVLRYTADGTPIGVGTAPRDSNDLVWAGDFLGRGTFFIQVTNFEPTTKTYQINITGGGVTLGR